MIRGTYYGKKWKNKLLSFWKNELPSALQLAEEKVCSERCSGITLESLAKVFGKVSTSILGPNTNKWFIV
jgi:hypothetical protein